MVNAGRVLIIPKGAWSNLVTYEMLDLVTAGDIAYIAKQSSVGQNPANDTAMTYWQPFGTAAKIATTSEPGLVMPDGTTITVDNTGLISAVVGITGLTDVTLTTLSNGQVLRYNGSISKWENVSLGSAAYKSSTNAVTQSSTDLVESGAVYTEVSSLSQALANKQPKTLDTPITIAGTQQTTVEGALGGLNDALSSAAGALYFTNVACSATTGDFLSKNDAAITADYVLAECVFANPSVITTYVTWTTSSGNITLNGTCLTATTANLVLVKKSN